MTTIETPNTAPPPAMKSSRSTRRWLLGAVALAVVTVGILLVLRAREFRQLADWTKQSLTSSVQVVLPQSEGASVEIMLPGNLTPFSEASLFARTNGYVKTWLTDLGAHVEAGQLMAEISAPDVDAQLSQATAALAQAQANLEIARLNYAREEDLLAKAVASQQEFEQFRATFQAAGAAVKAAQANVQNFTVQQDFQKIVAPFPGVVTARDIDVGDLVTADSNSATTTAQPLFNLARTDILRVFIDVPQIYTAAVKLRTKARLSLVEFPGETFGGSVTNISGALDPTTRTLHIEVQVPNADGRLFPGAYAQVHLILPVTPTLTIPSNALIFRGDGMQVGVVDGKGIVHLVTVSIGRDLGNTVEVTKGLDLADRVIVNPSDSIAEGQRVDARVASTNS